MNYSISTNEYNKDLITFIRNNDDFGLKNLMKKANKNHVPLNFNRIVIDSTIYYPFYEALEKFIGIIKIIMDYANDHNLFLNVNQKKKSNGETPILTTFRTGHIGKVRLLFEYSKNNDIILNINDKNKEGYNSLLISISQFKDSSYCIEYENVN